MSKENQAFSLIELLSVMAVISLMMGLLIPSLSGFASTYGRKQGVETVMNALERARVAALQSGGDVHVIFARPADSILAQDALIVVGEPPLGSGSAKKIFYTSWIKLPQGVHFRGAADTLALGTLPSGISSGSLPNLPSAASYSGITFNSTGQVDFPTSQSLRLAIFEGMRTGNVETAGSGAGRATKGLAESGLYDVVNIARFTGRSRADVTTLDIK
jgi:prepilin-type N-terminal cleavage/methylation domain-containing protein